MRKIVDYCVVDAFWTSDDNSWYPLHGIEGEVKKKLKDGWEPQGGITVVRANKANGEYTEFYYQAMVKSDE